MRLIACTVIGCGRPRESRWHCREHYEHVYQRQEVVCTGRWDDLCSELWPASRWAWCETCRERVPSPEAA